MKRELNFYESLVKSCRNGCDTQRELSNEQLLAIHNETSTSMKKLTDKSEKRIIAEILNDYVAQKEQVAELRARLDKAVELPCAIGETVYIVIKNCAHCQHYNASWAECRAPATANFDCESTHGTCFTQDVIEDECKKHLCVAELKFDLGLLDPKTGKLLPYYFTDREVAEARLKELQGGEN